MLLSPFSLVEPSHHLCFQSCPAASLVGLRVGQGGFWGLWHCAGNKSGWGTGQACNLTVCCMYEVIRSQCIILTC